MADSTSTIVGTLTRDPELRFTPGGAAICQFALAVNRRWKQNGEDKESVSFFDVKAWGSLGENAAASLVKGNRALVSGRLEQESWPDKDTGATRSKVVLVADAIGPDLRWATAVVERTQREGGTAPAKASTPAYGPDDEPF
jgi:single-strand DNA-binding protein